MPQRKQQIKVLPKRIDSRLSQYMVKATALLKDHFVPHSGNNHHPHVLKHRVLAGYSVLLVLLKVLAIVAPIALPSSSLYSSAITPQNIIDLTNQTRSNLDLGTLKLSDKLAQAAQMKADDMVVNQYFAHTSPAGITPWSWMTKAGYKYDYAGENLAVHFTSAESVEEGWLASPSHRANIVNPHYAEIGIGVSQGQFEGFATTFVVQMFGSPAVASVPVPTQPVTVPKTVAATPVPTVPAAGQVAAAEAKPKPVVVKPLAPVPVVTNQVVTPPVVAPAVTEVQIPQAAQPTPAVVDEASLKLVPSGESYTVSLTVHNATSVLANLGTQWATLQRQANTDTWQGTVAYDQQTVSATGEPFSVVAWSSQGTSVSEQLAWVAPRTPTQQLYTFNEGSDKFATFLGAIHVHNLQDSVTQFYVYFLVCLGAALIINILVKIRIQKLPVISHALLVMCLALFLIII